MTKKSAIISIIILVVIALGAWALYAGLSGRSIKGNLVSSIKTARPSSTPNSVVKLQAAVVTQVDYSKLPAGFPTDIPLEAKAPVIQNYSEIDSMGRPQTSRAFISSKSMAENLSLYQSALKAGGWTINQATSTPVVKGFVILANKDKNALSIFISTNAKSQVTVSIYNLTPPQ